MMVGHSGLVQKPVLLEKKVALQLKKEDHWKLKKRKGLGLVLNFQLGEGK